MRQFQRLMGVALIAGALAGFTLFTVQYWTIRPLIEEAEEYEAAAQPHDSGDTGWQPVGSQRTLFTALAAILNGIGSAAILFGGAALAGAPLTARNGALWGIAGLACFVLAPSLGLPPVPPGAAEAGLRERQIWWVATVLATAVSLWLLFRQRRWALRIGGIILIFVPHLIGAPATAGEHMVPDRLIRQFAVASVASQAVFWIMLGTLGGFLFERMARAQANQSAPES